MKTGKAFLESCLFSVKKWPLREDTDKVAQEHPILFL
ncbi:hypothetical protein J2S17_002451 [Cytobacillus purgationiresistens]|uniref:Uncharacterized protein n=1 Tax=Cytobacillus purgationiresistens TaxID=863449 RepID=A0ABU0AIP3_9BACI|nr:hypothetical protein [Cytobacillus purgationiresistens]